MKEFFEALNRVARPGRRDIIEKDYHLHRLLHRIAGDEHLSRNLVFKGGTCLIKAHLGYYRFSEDIDFTWKDVSIWEGRTASESRKRCSSEIDTMLERLTAIAKDLGMDFSGDKTDARQVHIGSGGRMVVFYMPYHSELQDRPERLKIEASFVDKIIYPTRKKALRSYAEIVETEEFRFYYKDQWREYSAPVKLDCYDAREIFVEKCRAALTRKVYKLRDIVDIYMLEKNNGYTIREYEKQIIEKTVFMLDLYSRYKENIGLSDLPKSPLPEGDEMKLLTIPVPEDLRPAMARIHRELDELREKMLG